jgi:hypothetical protein
MMKSFMAKAQLSSILDDAKCPESLKTMKIAFTEAAERTPKRILEPGRVNSKTKEEPLGPGLIAALTRVEGELAKKVEHWSMPAKGLYRKILTIGERDFAIAEKSHGDSGVFYRPLGSKSDMMVPGNIEEIVSVKTKNGTGLDLLFIRPLLSLAAGTDIVNPFADFPGLGASLWSIKTSDELDVVTSSEQMHHYAKMNWNKDIVVIKDLNRVGETYKCRLFYLMTIHCGSARTITKVLLPRVTIGLWTMTGVATNVNYVV